MIPYAYTVRLDAPVGPGWIRVRLREAEIIFEYISEVNGSMPVELGRCYNDILPLVKEIE